MKSFVNPSPSPFIRGKSAQCQSCKHWDKANIHDVVILPNGMTASYSDWLKSDNEKILGECLSAQQALCLFSDIVVMDFLTCSVDWCRFFDPAPDG
jgi:hypothetical protein